MHSSQKGSLLYLPLSLPFAFPLLLRLVKPITLTRDKECEFDRTRATCGNLNCSLTVVLKLQPLRIGYGSAFLYSPEELVKSVQLRVMVSLRTVKLDCMQYHFYSVCM